VPSVARLWPYRRPPGAIHLSIYGDSPRSMNHGLNADDWQQLAFRVLLAALAGAIVGYDRERRGKSAGLRTHILVSVGAALFTMVPITIAPDSAHPDESASRVVQGIAAGIGFLGAGEILRGPEGKDGGSRRVQGMTSAAAIWVAAALGAVAGSGIWQLLLIGAAITWIVLAVMVRVDRLIDARSPSEGRASSPGDDTRNV
jgi:putative Mg2+ transporter-C (MgtC) family protein